MRRSIIYCTHDLLADRVREKCYEALTEAAGAHELIVVHQSVGSLTGLWMYYVNLIAGIGMAHGDVVFVAEHDCLYPPGYFDMEVRGPEITYAAPSYTLTRDGFTFRKHLPLSTACGGRRPLQNEIRTKLGELLSGKRVAWSEPEAQGPARWLHLPHVDIRHGNNMTGDRAACCPVSDLLHWGNHADLWKDLGLH